ncbi:MAG TPA: thioesterase family protein [Roseiflexaceae bacterium]|nr:thioesterase family protein [Roseiflexaceae bacterium]
MTEATASALQIHSGVVPPEWIDYNEHLMDGYYLVAFSFATEAFLAHVGFGPAYREQTGCTIYTVEGHINFLREVPLGARLTYLTQILDYDAKRIHVIHSMVRADQQYLAATNELMFIHVNQATHKTEPMPAAQFARVEQIAQEHARLPRPEQAGRSVGIVRRTVS